MIRWLFVALLAIQAHFAASYLVPLDEEAQRGFGGLLRWAWPWSVGDDGPLGRLTSTQVPGAGLVLALGAASVSILAALALARWWVPFDWWRVLATAGAVLTLILMALFFSPTKILPILAALAILAVALGFWSPMAGHANGS